MALVPTLAAERDVRVVEYQREWNKLEAKVREIHETCAGGILVCHLSTHGIHAVIVQSLWHDMFPCLCYVLLSGLLREPA